MSNYREDKSMPGALGAHASQDALQTLAYQSLLLDQVRDVIIGLDQGLEINYWNKAAANLFGWKMEEVIGRKLDEVVRSELTAEQREEIRKIIERENVYQFDGSGYTRDGRRLEMQLAVATLRRADGFIYGYAVTVHDMTEEKRREAERLEREARPIESEWRFRTLVESNMIGVVFGDPQTGEVTGANDEFLRIIGRSRAELEVGLINWKTITPPDVLEREERLHAQIPPGEMRASYEKEYLRPDGTRVPVIIGGYFLDNDRRRVVAYVLDNTARKQVEEALRNREQTLKLFIEYAPAAIAMLDRDMRYIAASHRFLIDYRLGEQNIIGRTHYEIFPEIPEEWKEIHRRCLAGAVEKAEEDFFIRRDGSTDWVRWEIHPWYEQTGQVGGIIMFTEVVTERKNAAEQLKAYSDQLEQSNHELEDFAFIASHDLQEPLRKINMFSSSLRRKLSGSLDEEADDYLNRIVNASERMSAMIDGLLELARVNTRGGSFDPVNLTAIAEDVVSDLEARIQQTGGRVIIGELPSAEVDVLQIRRLLQNLIGNALKFHTPGVQPEVQVSGSVHHQGELSSIILTIQDNGIGFDEEFTSRIFQPFQRLHGKSEYEGTGMGLAICQKIVERHRGKIDVSSKPGEGAQFTITLPVKQRS